MARTGAALRPAEHDPTIYPTEEKVGEESLQRFIVELLRPLVERWLADRDVPSFTGADQFIYWRRHDATRRVAPDVFVLPGVRPGRRIRSWKTWEENITPSFALEVVSSDVDKDYVDAPRLYDELGVTELILFDPDHETSPDRFAFQVFRRARVGASRGRAVTRAFSRVEATRGDRVRSQVLACWLRAVGQGEALRLRVATGATGDDLLATPEEHERAEKERERAARLAAEAELAKLRAQLARPRGRR